jgi:two-component system phosphate regulon sensor histidine kinase PhoR
MIRVQDCGVGMSAEQCDRLFRQYERLERDAIRNSPGTGLGLYLVKNLVELHGGSICVESAPDLGSTFIVRLPRTQPRH